MSTSSAGRAPDKINSGFSIVQLCQDRSGRESEFFNDDGAHVVVYAAHINASACSLIAVFQNGIVIGITGENGQVEVSLRVGRSLIVQRSAKENGGIFQTHGGVVATRNLSAHHYVGRSFHIEVENAFFACTDSDGKGDILKTDLMSGDLIVSCEHHGEVICSIC